VAQALRDATHFVNKRLLIWLELRFGLARTSEKQRQADEPQSRQANRDAKRDARSLAARPS